MWTLFLGCPWIFFGEFLVNTLKDSIVDASYLYRSDGPTTLAFVTLVGGQASYAFYNENTVGSMILPDDMPHTLLSDIEALFFGEKSWGQTMRRGVHCISEQK